MLSIDLGNAFLSTRIGRYGMAMDTWFLSSVASNIFFLHAISTEY